MSLKEKMTAIADAIRAKTGVTETLTLDDMAREIAGITVGATSAPMKSRVKGILPTVQRGSAAATLAVHMVSTAGCKE